MHACKIPRLNILKMQLYFRNMKYCQDYCHSNTPTQQFLIMRSIFLNNCENNEKISSFNDEILNFLNVYGPYVIMGSVNFSTV